MASRLFGRPDSKGRCFVKLVDAWIEIHQEDLLLVDWELAVNGKKPFPIRGLDQ